MNLGTNYEIKNKVLFMRRVFSVPLKSCNLCTCLLYFPATLRLPFWHVLPRTITIGPLPCVSICKKKVVKMIFHKIQLNS